MSENWDFYALLVDSQPASIMVDLGIAKAAPIDSQLYMAYVRIEMRYPRPDGLSSNDEYEELLAVEQTLEEAATGNTDTSYVGRNTSSGNRDFYFYTNDPAAFANSVQTAMAQHPDYRFEVGDRLDRDWEVYFQFLYPSPDDLQRIGNRRVVDQLATHGDKHSEPRPIDHWAYLQTVDAASHLADELREQGFSVEEVRAEDDIIAVRFTRADRPDDIDEVVIPLARRIHEMGGEYDGWGCGVVN